MVTRHLINGQGKAKPENGKVDENVKFRLRCSKPVNLREADGVKRGGCAEKLAPKTGLTLPQHTGGHSCAIRGNNRAGGANREGCSFLTKHLEW